MGRRMPVWLLVGWAAAVAVLIPLTLWGVRLGVQALADRSHFVSAASASVSGDMVAVASANAGRVASLRATTGAAVRRGDTLADIELAAPVRTSAGGTTVMAFLGSTDQQVSTTAPVDGVVAAVLVTEGSSVTAGQTILRLIDPSHLRVTAYVNEVDISRVSPGQEAEVYFTALDRTLHGVVQVVVPATAGAFTPASAAGVEARPASPSAPVYPVYVRVDLRDYPQLLGSSAEVRIRVR